MLAMIRSAFGGRLAIEGLEKEKELEAGRLGDVAEMVRSWA